LQDNFTPTVSPFFLSLGLPMLEGRDKGWTGQSAQEGTTEETPGKHFYLQICRKLANGLDP
jgi:hypothetical protein